MGQPCILAIDLGTQSVRALLFDLQGMLLARAQLALDSYQSPEPGWMETDAEGFWQALCQVCQALWAGSSVPRGDIAALVLTTQRCTVINLDRSGQPLRPAIIWPDQRRAQQVPPLAWWWRAAFRAAGLRDTISFFGHEAEANWIAQNQPEIWSRTDKFLLLSGYLNYRLTGRFVDSTASQVAYVPFDHKAGRWAGRHDWRWQLLPIRRDMLPELVAPGSVIGRVSSAVAAQTGIPQDIPIVAGAADKACEVLGAGCITPDVACVSFGTAATINTTSRRYVEPLPLIPPFQSALPGHYNMEVQITRGFWMVSWFKDQFGLLERQLAQQRGVAPESLFDELVNAVPPGAIGLMLQPFWNPGIKVPGPEAKGAVIGFGDVHTRAHLYRAILEGLAYGMREGKERIERRSGVPVRRIRVAGGGSQSDAAMQICADIFNLPCERPHVLDASGLGAAILAAVGVRLHPDFPTAVAAMTRPGRVFEPDARHARTYEQLYRRVYCSMYRQLKPLYEEIRAITGYPPPG